MIHKKIAHYQQHLQKIQTHEFNTLSNQQLLEELREETKELAATLAAHIALQEGITSPINTLIQNSKSKNDLASCIRKKITFLSKNLLK
ncbi:hypothetical protein GGR08_000800 [Bartonella fuyuanensis]|uniref:Uncharacterized protein n=1 Tax=Bartonella fuyuanensis TaxID=1460968 RepID=A0A840DU47_9HYPH|nr:hypothetical protein [Bartonella fuyuanensis]